MDDDFKARVAANLFPSARKAVEPWEAFRWHTDQWTKACDSWKRHSSQALAIDVFGTLKVCPQPERDLILDGLAARFEVPAGGPWHVELEWSDPENAMVENRNHPTQVDAVAFGQRSVIFFECKFAERQLSGCSQVKPLDRGRHRGMVQCNGNFEPQVNPVYGVRASCALSGKGTRYWEMIPDLFGFSAGERIAPCPFAGPHFQWMRNLTVAKLVAKQRGLVGRVVVMYAQHAELPMAKYMRSDDWREFVGTVASPDRPLAVRTQDVVRWAGEASQSGTWSSLATWVDAKVDAAAAIQANRSRRR